MTPNLVRDRCGRQSPPLEAQQLLLAEGDRVRRDLLEDLLAGREPAPGPRLTAARAAGLDSAGRCMLIAAVPVTPPDDEFALRSAASAFALAAGGFLLPDAYREACTATSRVALLEA